MLDSITSNDGLVQDEDSESSESEDEEDLVEKSNARVMKSQPTKQALKKRLPARDVPFEPNKRRRDKKYRNGGDRLRENLRKLGNATNCYGILYLTRDVVLYNSTYVQECG